MAPGWPLRMCTLLALHRCFPEAPLVIAANRDEYHDRPASRPEFRRERGRWVVAPRDLRAGGTWLGWNDAGVFAGLTNRPTPIPDPSRRSRGQLVLDVLGSGSAKRAAERLVGLAAGASNPCNVLVADALAAYVVVLDGEHRMQELAPGAHVIGNADPDDRSHPKLRRLARELGPIADAGYEAALPALAGLLRSHERTDDTRGPLEATCIHAGPYGTRSSTLFVRGRRREEDRLLFAEGAPCTSPFMDMSALLGELDRVAGTSLGSG